MAERPSVAQSVANDIVDRVEKLINDAEGQVKPLEVDPFRGQLFEVFVTAEAAGYVLQDAEVDLTADGLCRALAARWGLAHATRESYEKQEKLPPGHLVRMRMLWSVMRMWMEWEYAWSRWPEFHDADRTITAPRPKG